MSDHAETDKSMALVGLAANFGKELPEPLLELWLDLLAPYPADMVRAAVKNVIENYAYKTLPPFAVLKSALDDLAGSSEKALELQAMSEWWLLSEAVARCGHNNKPALHPTTEHVVRLLGGWRAVCLWTYSDADFKRRDFIRLWVESHGRVEIMELGAAAVARIGAARPALLTAGAACAAGHGPGTGPLPLGTIINSFSIPQITGTQEN